MTQHFTRNTISAAKWCGKCQKSTQHRIDFVNELKQGGRIGPCLECMARYDNAPKVEKPEEKQEELFR
jgi:hypothetical protein